jgi:hypothetical protein
MWLVIYDGSVSDQVKDTLERFPFVMFGPLSGSSMPDPGLGATGFV